MATTYSSTASASFWKEYECVGCSSRFGHSFDRSASASSDASGEAAQKQALDALIALAGNAHDPHPCPQCGIYQPGMVGAKRAERYGYGFLIALAGSAAGLILGAVDWVALNMAVWLAWAAAAAALGLHVYAALDDPNRDIPGNRARAEAEVAKGSLALEERRSHGMGGLPGAEGLGGENRWPMLLLCLGLAGIGAAEGYRAIGRLPLNAGWYPPVAGPGDEPYLYFYRKIQSIKGYWKGNGLAEVLGAEGAAPEASWSVSGDQDSWGSSISAKSSEKYSSSTPWARVKIPADPALAGRTVRLNVRLDYSFPEAEGGGFSTRSDSQQESRELRLGSPGCAARYGTLWWAGGLLGAVLFLAGSWRMEALARRLSSGDRPGKVMVLKQPPS